MQRFWPTHTRHAMRPGISSASPGLRAGEGSVSRGAAWQSHRLLVSADRIPDGVSCVPPVPFLSRPCGHFDHWAGRLPLGDRRLPTGSRQASPSALRHKAFSQISQAGECTRARQDSQATCPCGGQNRRRTAAKRKASRPDIASISNTCICW